MNQVTATPATETATVAAPVAVAVPKAPSKKSLALAIFRAKMVERAQGLYASNKEFRAAILQAIQTDLGVSTASAATMYNSACRCFIASIKVYIKSRNDCSLKAATRLLILLAAIIR